MLRVKEVVRANVEGLLALTEVRVLVEVVGACSMGALPRWRLEDRGGMITEMFVG